MIRSVRGMYDITPDEIWVWQRIEKTTADLLGQYGFQQIRFPVVEKTALFHSSIGEATDVVEKEMFTFPDRKGELLSLRPEGTASVVRSVLQNNLIHNQVQKLWYNCPMFRYERPQKGRNRQFDQIGAEVFGLMGPDADAELLVLTDKLWQQLGLRNVRLEINSLGTNECRLNYRSVLIDYLSEHEALLDEEALSRLHTNPLRILDSKNPKLAQIIAQAPQISDYLNAEAQQHFAELREILDACEIAYTVNAKLVRGLDYYTHNVFEWITDELGAQGTICAGGRYNTLVEAQGGSPTPATGFAMGVDRLVEMVKQSNTWKAPSRAEVYVVFDDNWPVSDVFVITEKIRDSIPQLAVMMNLGGGSFKSQFKKADKAQAKFAIILGYDERQKQLLSIRSLVDREQLQQQLSLEDTVDFLQQNMS